MTVGENIKRIRKKKGFTQKALGELCNINEANIRKYENGKQNPKYETVRKIAKALGVDVWEIIEFNATEKDDFDGWRRLKISVDSEVGILAMLREVYGRVEEKSVYNGTGEIPYFLVGTENKFVLYEGDIDTLINTTKSALQPVVDRIKDTRPENDIVDELQAELEKFETSFFDNNN